jgi:hypothetical protein
MNKECQKKCDDPCDDVCKDISAWVAVKKIKLPKDHKEYQHT